MAATIKQLEALHWVARLGSFQAAAARLHTTQSAISKRISELETGLGRDLFDRSRRTAQLTPAGRRLSDRAQEILQLNERLFSELAEPQEFEGDFRLGATELIGMTWLPRYLRQARERYPALRLEVDVDVGGRLLEKLGQGRYDLALVPGRVWGKLFEDVPLRTLNRCWMTSPALGVPARTLTVQELAAYPVVSQYPDTVHAQLQSAWFMRAGHPMQQVVLANSFAVVGELVQAGLGIGLMPVDYYGPALRAGKLERIRVTPALPNVRYFAVYRRSDAHQLAPALAKLAKATCDFGARA